MKELVAIQPAKELGSLLHICWMLHNMCNQRCSYCRDHYWNGDFNWLDYNKVVGFLERIFSHYGKDTYHVSFTGGEVTLWPHFQKLVKFLRANNVQVGITTNGSRRMEYWRPLADGFNWMCISYHSEYAKDEHLLDVAKFFANRTRLSVRLMMHKEKSRWDQAIAFGERLRGLQDCKHLFVEYVPLQDDFGPASRPAEYADWQKEFFSRTTFFVNQSASEPMLPTPASPDVWQFESTYHDGSKEFCRPNELVRTNRVNFKGWSCYAGVEMLFIDHRGSVLRGGCRQGGQIGHIFDEKLNLPSTPIICEKNFCPCGTDILTKKFSPAYIQPIT